MLTRMDWPLLVGLVVVLSTPTLERPTHEVFKADFNRQGPELTRNDHLCNDPDCEEKANWKKGASTYPESRKIFLPLIRKKRSALRVKRSPKCSAKMYRSFGYKSMSECDFKESLALNYDQEMPSKEESVPETERKPERKPECKDEDECRRRESGAFNYGQFDSVSKEEATWESPEPSLEPKKPSWESEEQSMAPKKTFMGIRRAIYGTEKTDMVTGRAIYGIERTDMDI